MPIETMIILLHPKAEIWHKNQTTLLTIFRSIICKNDPINLQQILPDKVITDSIEQTNLYSYQSKPKIYIKDNRSRDETHLIGVTLKAEIVSLPSFKCYRS